MQRMHRVISSVRREVLVLALACIFLLRAERSRGKNCSSAWSGCTEVQIIPRHWREKC